MKFSIKITGDGPYFTPYKEIFSSIVSSTPITDSNFTTSPDFATVYLYIDTMRIFLPDLLSGGSISKFLINKLDNNKK